MSLKDSVKELLVPAANGYRIVKSQLGFSTIDSSRLVSLTGTGKKVLFHTIRSIPGNPLGYFEAIFAHAMQARGAESRMLFCGSYFNECDADHAHHPGHESFCRRCSIFRSEFIKSLHIPPLFYKDFISKDVETKLDLLVSGLSEHDQETLEYEGIDVGYISKMTLIRYYQCWKIPESTAAKERFKKTLIRCLRLVEIAKGVLEKERPDIMLTLHGVYAAWEPFFKYFVKKGICSYVYGVGMGDIGTMCFIKNVGVSGNFLGEKWGELREKDLTSDEIKELNTFKNERFWKDRGWISTLTNNLERTDRDQESFADFLNRKPDKRYALFTNVPWDNALIEGNCAFKDIFEWFDETIQYFYENKNIDLIIKVHPAERLDPQSYTFSKYIADKYPELPENIFVIPNDTKIRPYSLFPKIDCGIIYSGSLGLEMAMEGIPVLAAGKSHYSVLEVIVKPIRTKTEYFETLADFSELKAFHLKNIEYATRYGFAIFRRLETPLGFFKKDNFAHFDSAALRKLPYFVFEDFNVGNLCEQILKEQFVLRPENSTSHKIRDKL